MQAFDYTRVSTVDEAVTLLAQNNGQARILSGGTDLLVALREGRLQTNLVVDVKGIPELSDLHFSAQDGLTLGAAVPCHRLYNDEELAATYPGLMDAAHLIGGVQIQGRASLGGNLCNASPAADGIPALIAHGAQCVVAGPNGRRTLPVEEFCLAPGRTVLEPGDFLVKMTMPAPAEGFGAAYLRFIPRNEMDIAVVGVGAAVQLDASRSKFVSARISLGAVAGTPRPGLRWLGSRRSRSLSRTQVRPWSASKPRWMPLKKPPRSPRRPPRPSAICAARPPSANIWSVC